MFDEVCVLNVSCFQICFRSKTNSTAGFVCQVERVRLRWQRMISKDPKRSGIVLHCFVMQPHAGFHLNFWQGCTCGLNPSSWATSAIDW